MKLSRLSILALVLSTLLPLPAAAANAPTEVVYAGIDLWHTPDNGLTWAGFAADPIPADFFCSGSEPFSGRIYLKGLPIASDPPGVLGNADTIMLRPDDAFFNEKNVAQTQLQIRALSLVSTEPLQTRCGPYEAAVTLVGEQPISPNMTIVREREDGGYFLSEFDVNVKISFTPLQGRRLQPVSLERTFTMRGGPDHVWSARPGPNGVAQEGYLKIDTDADGKPDALVPGTSNFAVGWSPDSLTPGGPQPIVSSHMGASHQIEFAQVSSQ